MGFLDALYPQAHEQPATPAPWDDFWYKPIGSQTASGVDVSEDVAFRYSAVWACTCLLAGAGSQLPLNVYKRVADQTEPDKDHRVYDLLHNQPNGEMASMPWRALGLNHQINRGGAFSEIERDQLGRVEALWPIHASRVQPPKRVNGYLVYDIRQDDGSTYRLPAEDILHVPSIITEDGINGKGVIAQARESIGFGIAVERSGASFLGKGSKPSIIITHPGKLSKEARANFRREWNEIMSGPDNAGAMALLQEDAKASAMSINARDSQFLESRQFGIDEIARWYGVPPHLIQHLMKPTYASVEIQSIEFVVYSLMKWLRLWEQELERKLLTKEERKTHFIKHVPDALLRGDAASRTDALMKQFNNGALTLNEWRDLENRNPLPEDKGEKHFVPVNIQTVERAIEGPEVTAPPSKPTSPVSDDPIRDAEDPDGAGSDDTPDEDQAENAAEYRADVAKLREEIAEMRVSQQKIVQTALNSAIGGMIRKEINEVRTIAKKPAEFLRRVDEFYENFGRLFTDVITPYQACPSSFVAAHIAKSKAELLEAAECKPSELTDAVERLLMKWKTDRGKLETT